jgi:hypothetical protein
VTVFFAVSNTVYSFFFLSEARIISTTRLSDYL